MKRLIPFIRREKGAPVTPSTCGMLLTYQNDFLKLSAGSRIDVVASEMKGTTQSTATEIGSVLRMRREKEEAFPTLYSEIAMHKTRGISTAEAIEKLAFLLKISPKEITYDSKFTEDVSGTQILYLENKIKYGQVVRANLIYQTMIHLKWNSTISRFLVWFKDNEKKGDMVPKRLGDTVSPRTPRYLRFYPYLSTFSKVPFQGHSLKLIIPGIKTTNPDNLRRMLLKKMSLLRQYGCPNFYDSIQCELGSHSEHICWNILASMRLKLSNTKVLKGDIVSVPVDDDSLTNTSEMIKRVESQEEAATYCISDVVLPIPMKGQPSQSPDEIEVTGKTSVKEKMLIPTHLCNPPGDPYALISRIVSDNFNYEGHCEGYRRLVVVPKHINFSILPSYVSTVDDFNPEGVEKTFDDPAYTNIKLLCRLPLGSSHVTLLKHVVGDDPDDTFNIF
eukprot:TRINITY_DN825_c5_g1_i1.p1 TRINITY_DN825_c5_g1~~TRINITY_DN825_c5_g1_i1.p1  ORF type:complete len:470 (+),score=61.35 TRINITY_DN825_c5_g1_i1:70-1410(+)